jgi:Ca-activated chloride channel homolog
MIGMQGKKIDFDQLPPSNLVFLIDVSGSMQDENKLPLVKSSLNLLADQLRAQDKIIPAHIENAKELGTVDPLRYQNQEPAKLAASFSDELMFVKIRYKKPDEHRSNLMEVSVKATAQIASNNMRFASAVAAFGMVLRNSAFKGNSNYKLVNSLVTGSVDSSSDAYKKEFLELVKKAEQLKNYCKG